MQQPSHARAIILLTATTMVALGVAFVWLHLATPSDGARLEPGQQVWRPNGVVITTLRAQPGGLRTGDLVVAVEGSSLESWAEALANPTLQRPSWHVGQTITYTVVRDGATLDVPVTLIDYPLDAIWQRGWSTILFALVFEFIALYIVLRRPSEQAPLALLLSASGILGGTTWSFGLQVSDLVGGTGFWLYKATTFVIYMMFYIAGLHFALIFPRRLPILAGRSHWLWPLFVAPYALYLVYLAAIIPGSASTLDWLGRWIPGESSLAVLLLLSMVTASIWNYRIHPDPETRKKIRWIVFGALAAGLTGLALWNIPGAVLGHPLISTNALGLLVLPFPLTIAIAILRHRLFDIDTILNRTLVYGGLSGIIIALYIAIVGALSTLFQARGNLLIALVAAGVVAVIFQPLRVWLQRVVDRVMFGERDNPYAVLSRLGQRLETALAPDMILPAIVETVANALKLPSATIAIKDGDEFTASVEYGVPSRAQAIFPLVYQSETVGQLRVSLRAPDEPLTDADKHLLEDIAHQAGIAVHATRLTTDLQRSRARLVTTREEERRRLRRDLHDGIGPTLAGMTLKIGAIRNVLTSDPATADHLLEELSGEIDAAMTDIRRLVYALRPPALDELGLVAALRAYAAQYQMRVSGGDGVDGEANLRVTIEAPPDLPALPAAVEVAAYRIACEALTNVTRHARARICHITIALDSALHMEIADDGVGLAAERRMGVGLISMRERAEELGGSCAITSATRQGTRVRVELPLAKE